MAVNYLQDLSERVHRLFHERLVMAVGEQGVDQDTDHDLEMDLYLFSYP